MRVFVASVRKLIGRPATFVTFGLLVGLLALIILAVSATANQIPDDEDGREALLLVTFPFAYTFIVSFILGLGGLFAVIFAAAIAGSEWTWGTLKSAVARGESRARYQLLSFAAIALMLGIGLVLATGIGVLLAILGANIAGVSTAGLDDSTTLKTLPDILARGWLGIVMAGGLGFTIATLSRSQLAGIGAGIGVYFTEQFATIFLPDIVRYLPFHAASAVVEVVGNGGGGGGGGGGVGFTPLEPDQALLACAAWLIGALAVATIFTERAEISG